MNPSAFCRPCYIITKVTFSFVFVFTNLIVLTLLYNNVVPLHHLKSKVAFNTALFRVVTTEISSILFTNL